MQEKQMEAQKLNFLKQKPKEKESELSGYHMVTDYPGRNCVSGDFILLWLNSITWNETRNCNP